MGGGYRGDEGIQPERLNAEGEARVLLAEGGASAQPPEYRHHQEKRLEDAKAAAKASDIRVLRIMVGWHDTEGYASLTLGYEPLALLGHSTFQVVLPACGFTTDFHRNRRISTMMCYLCHILCYLCLLWCLVAISR